jgi:MFS family permease
MNRSPEDQLRYAGWPIVAASGTSLFFTSFIIYTFPVFFKPLAAEFAWSRESVSLAYGLMALTAAITAPAFGYIFDRVRVRHVILPCMAAAGAGFASLALLAPRLWQFYGTFVLLGGLATALSPVAYSRAVSTWFERRRGLALGLVIGGGALAGIVQPPATQLLIDLLGWRGAYIVIGLAMVTIGCPVVACIRERPRGDAAAAAVAGATLGEGLRTRAFWTLVVVFFASSLAMNGAIVHLSALLTDRGVSAAHAALALSTMGGASLLGRLVTGTLLDRFFGARVSCVLLSVVALGTFLLATAGSFATGALAAALIGFGMGGELDVTPYLLSRYFGLRAFSTLYGIVFGSSALAGAVGPILLGRTFDATGSYGVLLPRIALLVFAVALLMLTLPRYDLRTAVQAVSDSQPAPLTSAHS